MLEQTTIFLFISPLTENNKTMNVQTKNNREIKKILYIRL